MSVVRKLWGIEIEPENIPVELRAGNWCVWKAKSKGNGKHDKIPHGPSGAISTAEPYSWMTFDQAVSLYNDNYGMYNGIGRLCARDGFSVIDIDNSKSIPDEVKDLGPTYVEASPSGKGLRIVYRGEIPDHDITSPFEVYSGNSSRFLTFTGRVKALRPINDVGEKLRDLVHRHRADFDIPEDIEDDPFAGLIRPDFSTEEIVDMLEHIDPDAGHDTWFKVMQGLHHQYEGSDEGKKILTEWSRPSEDFDQREIDTRWRSLKDDGPNNITAASIKHIAKLNGYDPAASILSEEKVGTELASDPDTNSQIFQRMSEELLSAPHNVRWAVKGIIEEATVGQIFGPSGVGKSFFAIDLACCIATGRDFHGHKVKKGQVLYLAGEGHAGVIRRIKGWAQENGNPDMSDLIVSRRAINFGSTKDLRLLKDYLDSMDKPPSMIFIDTLARATAGMSENDANEMGPFMERLAALARLYNCTIGLVHHSPKSGTSEGRGSSAIKGALDWEIRCTGLDGGPRGFLVESSKMKDAEPFDAMAFKLVSVTLPENFNDEDGEPTTTAIIEPIQDVESVSGKGKLTKTGSQVIKCIDDCLADDKLPKCGPSPEMCQNMGMDAPGEGVYHSDVRDRFERLHGTEYAKTSGLNQAVKRGIEDAVDKGLIFKIDEVIYKYN